MTVSSERMVAPVRFASTRGSTSSLIVFHTAIDMMEVIRQLVAEGWQVTAEDLAQLSPYLTSHILRFGAYATDELHIPPDVFDPALDEVDFGGEQPAAA